MKGTKIIKYASFYYEEENETVTLYFIVKKSMLPFPNNDPDVVAAMLSLEFPVTNIEARHAGISISPITDTNECIGWEDITMPYDEVEELIEYATKLEQAKNIKGGMIYG